MKSLVKPKQDEISKTRQLFQSLINDYKTSFIVIFNPTLSDLLQSVEKSSIHRNEEHLLI